MYVKFLLHDDLGKLDGYDKSKVSFVIWTTTIWTLPGNLAIALHPEESYALVQNPNGEIYILAEALVKKVMEVGGVEGYTVLATHPGSFFENMLASSLKVSTEQNHWGVARKMMGFLHRQQWG